MQHQKNTGSYDVGYKKPPRHSQFKPGNRGNPKGRGKRQVLTEREIAENVMNFAAEFFHRGKRKRAPRIELTIKRFGAAALKGDVGAAAMLLKLRAYFAKHGDTNVLKLGVIERVVIDPKKLHNPP